MPYSTYQYTQRWSIHDREDTQTTVVLLTVHNQYSRTSSISTPLISNSQYLPLVSLNQPTSELHTQYPKHCTHQVTSPPFSH
ncbi:hypothetical protein L873DRAFT_1028151 [Choiromyces venosus 120613-1]|uniref:Uncharacterized protein n=1 Tax=Choiromyces venosus 120613-1 TaxID=1336337 RepID=A0A3N4JMF0_9PEZI|nr:hypothetical protein L873DRAFT_1028151 [Choiromyces venosus 120613-1]